MSPSDRERGVIAASALVTVTLTPVAPPVAGVGDRDPQPRALTRFEVGVAVPVAGMTSGGWARDVAPVHSRMLSARRMP